MNRRSRRAGAHGRKNPDLLYTEARAAFDRGDPRTANEIADLILRDAPESPGALELKGHILRDRDRPEEALRYYQRVESLAPASPAPSYHAGIVLMQMGKYAQARHALQKALRGLKRHPGALAALGHCHLFLGEMTESESLYRQALEIDPSNADALYSWIAHFHTFRNRDDPWLARLHAIEHQPSLDDEQHILALYGLRKAYEDLGEFDRAFDYALRAARRKRSRVSYDPRARDAYFAAIRAWFTPGTLARHAADAHPSEQPVFIAGMPRSGTTLVEQILHAHPQAAGIGEDAEFISLLKARSALPDSEEGAPWPYSLPLTQDSSLPLRAVAQLYIDYLAALAPGKARVVNKAIYNPVFLGAILLAFPNARVLHTVRDPLDTCVSAFTQNFRGGAQPFTYDLAELGDYYRGYRELMDFWHARFPGRILDISYEAVVSDLEGEAQRILAFIGLPWDESCLRFFAAGRAVQTASVAQVRKPVYQSSVRRWKVYEKHLSPLIDSLGEYAQTAGTA